MVAATWQISILILRIHLLYHWGPMFSMEFRPLPAYYMCLEELPNCTATPISGAHSLTSSRIWLASTTSPPTTRATASTTTCLASQWRTRPRVYISTMARKYSRSDNFTRYLWDFSHNYKTAGHFSAVFIVIWWCLRYKWFKYFSKTIPRGEFHYIRNNIERHIMFCRKSGTLKI